MLAIPTIFTMQDALCTKTSIKTISAVATAVVVSAWVLAFQSVSAEVAAHPQTPAAQIDRINIGPTVVKCQQAWPYYERSCLQGRNELPGKIRTVRLIAVDRVQAPNSTATVAK